MEAPPTTRAALFRELILAHKWTDYEIHTAVSKAFNDPKLPRNGVVHYRTELLEAIKDIRHKPTWQTIDFGVQRLIGIVSLCNLDHAIRVE